jgi:hypothetical protein
MAAAIRSVLESNPEISLRDCREEVKRQHPDREIKDTSFGVAFSNQRAKLGLAPRRGGRKSVRRRKPGTLPAAAGVRPTGVGLNLDVLQAARKYVAAVGDSEQAISAIRQLQTLQLN